MKTVLITGATGKLGRAFIELYGNEYNIVGVSRHYSESNLLKYFHIKKDICGHEEQIVNKVVKEFGSIDILINNAVDYFGRHLDELEGKDLQRVFAINVTAAHELSRFAVARYMREHGGSIIHVGSFSHNSVHPYSFAYSASKAALHMLMKYQTHEYREIGNLRSNIFCPTSFPSLMPTNQVAQHLNMLASSILNGVTLCCDQNKTWIQ